MTKGKENRILQSSDWTFSPSDRANTGTSDQAFSLSDDNNVLNQEIYFIRDYLGNIKSIFDNNGEMLYYRLYDEFGNEGDSGQAAQESLNLGAAQTPAFGFTSREFDEIADLYFYRSRYYDPQIGRFTQRDKFNEAGFITGNPAVIYNPLQLNDYTYVGNNPLNFIDPWGYCKGEMNTWIYKYMKIKPAWLPPFEKIMDKRIGGEGKTQFFNISYGKEFQQMSLPAQESVRYHEFIHFFQIGRSYFDLWDIYFDKPYPRTEMEAYTRQKNLIEELIKQTKNPHDLADLQLYLEQIIDIIKNPEKMW